MDTHLAAALGRSQLIDLTTTGRRSGRPRTVALAYVEDGDGFVVVASNGGSDRPPAWWGNLRHRPEAVVELGATTVPVVAREATDEERARLWPHLKAVNPFYAQYEQITARRIPVVILSRGA
jgi:deazaflavin-dependent oxidoreductase (nitroreductase family)